MKYLLADIGYYTKIQIIEHLWQISVISYANIYTPIAERCLQLSIRKLWQIFSNESLWLYDGKLTWIFRLFMGYLLP